MKKLAGAIRNFFIPNKERKAIRGSKVLIGKHSFDETVIDSISEPSYDQRDYNPELLELLPKMIWKDVKLNILDSARTREVYEAIVDNIGEPIIFYDNGDEWKVFVDKAFVKGNVITVRPERCVRVFRVPVRNLNPEEIESYISEMKDSLRS
jgi:hypothetical protein